MNAWILLSLLGLLITQSVSIGEKLFTGKVYTGKTNNWKTYSGNGIYVDVDFDELDLCKTPKVFVSLLCTSHCWMTTGATSIYLLSNDHFRVYVAGVNWNVSVQSANQYSFELVYTIYSEDDS